MTCPFCGGNVSSFNEKHEVMKGREFRCINCGKHYIRFPNKTFQETKQAKDDAK